MTTGTRYVHTNLIARDWRRLAAFYAAVFGCRPAGPERDLAGQWLDRLTALENAHIAGLHLSLPGCDNGPTLEIFSYRPADPAAGQPQLNGPGLAHLAFHVDDVAATLRQILAAGGGQVGELVVNDYGALGVLTVVYARDPEGNILEIQHWQK